MDTKELSRIAEIDVAIKNLKMEIDQLKLERDQMEDRLIEEMAECGLEKLTISTEKGPRTVYVHRQVWAGHTGDKEGLCDALIEAGLGEYVKPTFNTNQLSAYIREFDPDGTLTETEIIKKLPERIQPFLKVSERFQLKSRNA